MRVDLFDYVLPPDRIALEPADPRESARLLHIPAAGPFHDLHVADLSTLLRPGDAVVVNDTRVISARLDGTRARGDAVAAIEATLIKRVDESRWRALVRPAKKLKLGERARFTRPGENATLDAIVEDKGEAGKVLLAFDVAGAVLDQMIERLGMTPLPPYIAARRSVAASDREKYQTIFADQPGAVAAPTAGLHFTPNLIAEIEAAGATLHRVTLHVGAGTFLPVKTENTDDHVMHAEWGQLDAMTAASLNQARAKGGRIVAIGTTSLRLLESAAAPGGELKPFAGETEIFITPGYAFRAVDAVVTNFHLPKSTLLMLISAFSGVERVQAAYSHAISHGYRFYSYGDACLFERPSD